MKIKLENISKSFDSRSIIQDFSYVFDPGMIYGIVGSNGSGKTVLLKSILGLISLDGGAIFFDDQQLGRDFEFPHNTGFVIEKPLFIDEYSGFDNLKLLASIRNLVSNDVIFKWLNKFQLSDSANVKVKNYSLGMKQRLAIVQAIMEDPELLVLDEPMNSVDKYGVDETRKLLKEFRESGQIFLLTPHIQADIDTLCDKIIYL